MVEYGYVTNLYTHTHTHGPAISVCGHVVDYNTIDTYDPSMYIKMNRDNLSQLHTCIYTCEYVWMDVCEHAK